MGSCPYLSSGRPELRMGITTSSMLGKRSFFYSGRGEGGDEDLVRELGANWF